MTDSNFSWDQYTQSVKRIKQKKIKLGNKKTSHSEHSLSFLNSFYSNCLDLHGHTLDRAFCLLENFLKASINNDIRKVLVITGKGSNSNPSILKLEVPRWLKYTSLAQLITNVSPASDKLGGSGAIVITLTKSLK